MPSEFVTLAEDTGLIHPIGEWVLIEACAQLATWRAQGLVADDFTVSVNLSPRQLSSRRLPDAVETALALSQLPPGCLCLEVTESCVAEDEAGAATMLARLKQLGVLLALDDFGTGYSCLSALSTYPLDVVKIDRSFVERVVRDPAAARMFGAVLGVVRAAQCHAVAEGVEAGSQLEVLTRMGCDCAQGFLFARPAPAQEIGAWLASAAR